MMGTGEEPTWKGYWRCKQRHYKRLADVAGFGDLGLFCKRMYAAFY